MKYKLALRTKEPLSEKTDSNEDWEGVALPICESCGQLILDALQADLLVQINFEASMKPLGKGRNGFIYDLNNDVLLLHAACGSELSGFRVPMGVYYDPVIRLQYRPELKDIKIEGAGRPN